MNRLVATIESQGLMDFTPYRRTFALSAPVPRGSGEALHDLAGRTDIPHRLLDRRPSRFHRSRQTDFRDFCVDPDAFTQGRYP
jgi:hypothetical protein